MLIKKLINPFSRSYLDLKNEVFSSNFPWHFTESTTGKNKNIFLSHLILKRPEENYLVPKVCSSYFDTTLKIVQDIFNVNNIKPNCILRLNLNCTLNWGGGFGCDPHKDHDFEHKNMIVYLNSSHGATVVCDEESNIEEYFHPEEDAIIQFEGLHYHYQPNVGERRIVLVITYF